MLLPYFYIVIVCDSHAVFIWAVTEKVWLRAMYSDGIAAETRKTEGDLKTEG